MPIDAAKALALELPPLIFEVERGRLRFFAKSIGESNPLYTDVQAAVAAGYPDLVVPPTFFSCMEFELPDPFYFATALDIDLRFMLHGEQAFEFHALAHAGDTITLTSRFVDVISKKGGALDVLTKQTEFARGGELIARSTNVLIVRNPEATS